MSLATARDDVDSLLTQLVEDFVQEERGLAAERQRRSEDNSLLSRIDGTMALVINGKARDLSADAQAVAVAQG